MKYGHRLGCHQRPDRSLFIKGYQFPVCARCTGVMSGYLFGIALWSFLKLNFVECILMCVPMLVDWGIQYLKIREATQSSRLVTGFLGGLGIMDFQINIILLIIKGRII